MNHEAASAITRKLQWDESLLWSGQPKQGLLVQPGIVLRLPAAFLWGLLLVWGVRVLANQEPQAFVWSSALFLLGGALHLFGRCLADAQHRAYTFYGLTDRRVIIIYGPHYGLTRSLPLDKLHDVGLSFGRDGVGTVRFGRRRRFEIWTAGFQSPVVTSLRTPSFLLLAGAERVHARVRTARLAAV